MEEEEETALKALSMDYLNLLINGQAFSDVSFGVEGRVVHAHRCILAARSLFFRRFFCDGAASRSATTTTTTTAGLSPMANSPGGRGAGIIAVTSVSYEVFLLVLQFLYSGQVSLVPQKHEARPNCPDRSCWHTHCPAAVDLALDILAAARSFGVEPLALLTQKHLVGMVEKASIEDVMKVLVASRKQNIGQLWTTCSHLVAKSGLPAEVLAKHLPLDVVAKIEEIRLKISSFARGAGALFPAHLQAHQQQQHPGLELAVPCGGTDHHLVDEQQKIRRMRRALDSSDVELVKLMVMGEGLNLDDALALHYAVENCCREVVKALLELGAADVNRRAGPAGKTPLHVAAEMVCPDMVAVLLDHHADPTARTLDGAGVTPLDVLRGLTSDFLFKGAGVPGLAHVEPNKLRLCLELVQSAALVMSREEAAAAAAAAANNNNTHNNSSDGATSHHHSINIYPR
ncbi:BTB/POZ domain and ankyrin repeat-containing protein NPR5-like [Curcuma longa]|uniref:BTB/POZ domain and ankyrin repeat-containing protein NPR5-like n=1 Tax=Curcuma longa TaxID=136217 RepID=UPI003D9E56E8